MKLNIAAVKRLQRRNDKGFTLIEMIGVLAIIAMLAAILVPKVFGAINDARISNVVASYEGIKPALVDHYAKYGGFDVTKGGAAVAADDLALYDTKVLVPEGFIDKPFVTKVSSPSHVQVVACKDAVAEVKANDGTYCLSGITANANEASGTYVVEAVIEGVTPADAQAISERIDGVDMSKVDPTNKNDLAGRVKYDKPGANGLTTVYMYLTHR